MSETGQAMRIVELDPFDDAAFDAWHAVYDEAERFGREETADLWQLEEVRTLLQHVGSHDRHFGWSGLLDGRTVAAGWMVITLLDNVERANLSVHVLPEYRRRGLGSQMLARVEREAAARGRTILGAEVAWPYDSVLASEGAGVPGPEFARARGYELALTDVQREVRLPVAEARLDELAAEAAPHHAAYTLKSWVGPVPDGLLQGWAELSSSLTTEAPLGDLALEPETASVEVHREREALQARQGRVKYNTVALNESGETVAYTDLATTIHEPGRAYQWGTLVRQADRGHRLGIAVKVANLRLLQAERPDILRLTTYNAQINAHMVAVNELMGFRPVEMLGEFQKHLT